MRKRILTVLVLGIMISSFAFISTAVTSASTTSTRISAINSPNRWWEVWDERIFFNCPVGVTAHYDLLVGPGLTFVWGFDQNLIPGGSNSVTCHGPATSCLVSLSTTSTDMNGGRVVAIAVKGPLSAGSTNRFIRDTLRCGDVPVHV